RLRRTPASLRTLRRQRPSHRTQRRCRRRRCASTSRTSIAATRPHPAVDAAAMAAAATAATAADATGAEVDFLHLGRKAGGSVIIETQDHVTAAVLGEMHRTPDARPRELPSLFVKHLHAFVREAKLTEREFQDSIGSINAIGKQTTPSHNEAMLLAGALGVSNL